MALTAEQKTRIAELSAKRIFGDTGATCTVDRLDFEASAEAIDVKLDTLIAAGDVGTQFDNALNSAIPSPVSTLANADKAMHFAITIAVRHGAM